MQRGCQVRGAGGRSAITMRPRSKLALKTCSRQVLPFGCLLPASILAVLMFASCMDIHRLPSHIHLFFIIEPFRRSRLSNLGLGLEMHLRCGTQLCSKVSFRSLREVCPPLHGHVTLAVKNSLDCHFISLISEDSRKTSLVL